MKRRFLIGSISAAVIVILFALMWLYFSKQNLTAYAFLEKHTVASDPLFAAEEYLTEVSLDNHTILLFYLNREGTVSCAVVWETPFSYHLLRQDGGAPITTGQEAYPYHYIGYQDGNDWKWVAWGIRSDNVKSVSFNGKTMCNVFVPSHSLDIVWLTGTGIVEQFQYQVTASNQ